MSDTKQVKKLRTTPSAPSEAPLGLRERNKLHKEKLIREAARSLFIKNGFETTTLREVAERAGVGFGTVFAYAADKAGLLAMIYVEELKALPALFDEHGESQGDALAELIEGLGKLYHFWAVTPTLSRHVLQQMEFYADNPHMELIIARRAQARQDLTDWILRLQGKGRIATDIDAHQAAATIFAIYTSAVREWSATAPDDVIRGIDHLRELMVLPMRGLELKA